MRKAAFIIFAVLLIGFILWNCHRAGILARQDEEIIARADYLISRSERSIERWSHK